VRKTDGMAKILIIEDEDDIRKLMLFILHKEGYEVFQAVDGAKGVQVAQEQQPDLIISDVVMPEMNGYQTLTTLRQDERTRAIPFIFLTSKAEKHDLRQGMNLGADDYLTKPFTRSELLEAIRTRLTRQAMTAQKYSRELQNLEERYNQLVNRISIISPARNLDRLNLEGGLGLAVGRNEFELYYQPLVELKTRQIVGMEALVRWRNPLRGLVLPGEFIPLAEESGLIIGIGEWVLRAACTQAKAWQKAGFGPRRVAVNMSAHQFNHPDICQTILGILDETGLESKYLELELTESAVVQDFKHTVTTLNELKALGVQVSIDDFGTGYSSLSYLKNIPATTLKIDQSFVRNITLDPDYAIITKSIIELAHTLHLKVIAEGVETHQEWTFLEQNHCDEVQGYLFSRPLPAAKIELLLNSAIIPEPPDLLDPGWPL
jgi:EAL domain-containing protein (putative c-di-GMP-specific phosphodiesterase class I)/CheY-like chemotaxis protein